MAGDGKGRSKPRRGVDYPGFRVFGIGLLLSTACFFYFIQGCNFFAQHSHENDFNSSATAGWTGLKAVVVGIIGLFALLIGLGAHLEYLRQPPPPTITDAEAAAAARKQERDEEWNKKEQFEKASTVRALRHEEQITRIRKERARQIEALQNELERYKAIPSEDLDEQD